MLAGVFKKLTVFKPATSKEGNSEVYVICENFQGLEDEKLQKLIDSLCQEECSLFSADAISDEFKEKVKQCSNYFMDIQTKVIKNNVYTFDNEYSKEAVKELKSSVAQKFIKDYSIKKLEPSDAILPNNQKAVNYVDDCHHLDVREESGTFLDRITEKTNEQKIESLKFQLSRLYPSWCKKFRKVEWAYSSLKALPTLQVVHGLPFNHIESSKFCLGKALKSYKQSCELSENLGTVHNNHSKRQKLDPFNEVQTLKDCFQNNALLQTVVDLYPEVLDSESLVMNFPNTNILENTTTSDGKKSIEQLIKVFEKLQRGRHLILLNYVALTRLQVGVLFLLTYYFEEIGFMRPQDDQHGIFLSEFKGDLKIKDHLQTVLASYSEKVMSVLPTEYLTQEPIYSMLVAHNINILRESSIAKLIQNNL